MLSQFLKATSQFIAYDGDDDAAKAAAEAAAAAAAKKAKDEADDAKQFSQNQLNTFLADEKRKTRERERKQVIELENLKTNATLTIKQTETLERRIEELQTANMTAEEKARRAEEVAEKKRGDEVKNLTNERDTWQNKHSQLVINTAIVGAAAEQKALYHEQITAILTPKTKLVEKVDDDGKPTGEYEPRVSFPDKDKDDQPIILELTVPETIKRMKELEQYGNLFEGGKTGGLGGTGGTPTGKGVDLTKIAKDDPKEYRKLRKKRMSDE